MRPNPRPARHRAWPASLVFMWVVLGAPCVQAAEIFRAELLPNPGVESAARGAAEFVLDGTETEIAFTVEYEGLSSPEIMAHVHGPAGEILFTLPPGSTKSGIWQDPGPINVFLLRSQQLFVLVHSERYPVGELRGDLRVPVSVGPNSWSAVKALFRAVR